MSVWRKDQAGLLRTETVGTHGSSAHLREQASRRDVSLVYFEGGRRRQRKLGLSLRDVDGKPDRQAQKQAVAALHAFVGARSSGALAKEPHDPTFAEVIEAFRREWLPSLSKNRQEELQPELEYLGRVLGSMKASTFTANHWNHLQRQRQSGAVDCQGRRVPEGKRKPVSPQTSCSELRTLRQVCRWASRQPMGEGDRRMLLPQDPTAVNGCDLLKNPNPKRPVADDGWIERMLERASEVSRYLPTLLVLAGESGRRRGALVALRWEDVRWEAKPYGELRWRADEDKLGAEWATPMSERLREALSTWRKEQMQAGGRSEWIFPAVRTPQKHVSPDLALEWLKRLEVKVRGYHVAYWGWHSLRRAWAISTQGLSAKDAAHLGGWKNRATMERVYQRATKTGMIEVLEGRGKVVVDQPKTA